MKKNILFVVFILCAFIAAKAQDVIVLLDASEIQAKVKNVGINEITYVKWENPTGPDYQIHKKEVFFIRYMDGSKDVFNSKLLTSEQEGKTPNGLRGKYIQNILLNGYIEMGVPFTSTAVGPSLQGVLGVRFYDYGSIAS